jgi:DNA invertase Pin-like site-specific DNA recombinase
MHHMMIGYARVSTQEQDTDLQLRALKRAGCKKIFQEQRSAVSHRPQLNETLERIKSGDVLVVYKLDRLARSLKQLLTIIERLELAGAGFKSLTEPIDTSTPAGRLMMQMLGAVAEFERSLITERSKAGQDAARARGAVFGRKRALAIASEKLLVTDYDSGDYSLSQLATKYGIHESSVKRAVYRVHKPFHTSLR